MKPLPRILCIGGHDPTGGAGIQADIETVHALGGHAMTLLSCLTAQDTDNIHAIEAIRPDFFARQLRVLLEDVGIDAIKLGILGSGAIIEQIGDLVQGFSGPVVLDPVLAAGGGFDLDGDAIGALLRRDLLPHTTLATPNRAELRRLAAVEDETRAAQILLDEGCEALLVTGADEADGAQIRNQLLDRHSDHEWYWPRLPHQYHGSGCTLASACAVLLAQGHEPTEAAGKAQDFAWNTLAQAHPIGRAQMIPRRNP